MIFSTLAFLFLFLPPVLLAALFLKKEAQNFFLLLASLFFYAWGEGALVIVLLASALLNHGFGLAIQAGRSGREKKAHPAGRPGLQPGIAGRLQVCRVFRRQPESAADGHRTQALGNHRLAMPLGISFFTFMAIAYLIEVYNRSCPAEKNFLHTALFIAFFPTVLAGPINRYSRLKQQMSERQTTPELLATGIRRFIIGLGKKVLLADTLARTADQIFAIPASGLSSGLAWLGAICYTLQIFLDFSGYRDMAIGLGRMFGFTFMENFNYPLHGEIDQGFLEPLAHFAEHLAARFSFPAAGIRHLAAHRRRPLARHPGRILELLPGHVADHAAMRAVARPGLDLHRLGRISRRLDHAGTLRPRQRLKRLWLPLQNIYGLLVVGCGWVLFRAVDLSHAGAYWRSMFGFGRGRGRGFIRPRTSTKKHFSSCCSASRPLFPFCPRCRRGYEKSATRASRLSRPWLQAGGLLADPCFFCWPCCWPAPWNWPWPTTIRSYISAFKQHDR